MTQPLIEIDPDALPEQEGESLCAITIEQAPVEIALPGAGEGNAARPVVIEVTSARIGETGINGVTGTFSYDAQDQGSDAFGYRLVFVDKVAVGEVSVVVSPGNGGAGEPPAASGAPALLDVCSLGSGLQVEQLSGAELTISGPPPGVVQEVHLTAGQQLVFQGGGFADTDRFVPVEGGLLAVAADGRAVFLAGLTDALASQPPKLVIEGEVRSKSFGAFELHEYLSQGVKEMALGADFSREYAESRIEPQANQLILFNAGSVSETQTIGLKSYQIKAVLLAGGDAYIIPAQGDHAALPAEAMTVIDLIGQAGDDTLAADFATPLHDHYTGSGAVVLRGFAEAARGSSPPTLGFDEGQAVSFATVLAAAGEPIIVPGVPAPVFEIPKRLFMPDLTEPRGGEEHGGGAGFDAFVPGGIGFGPDPRGPLDPTQFLHRTPIVTDERRPFLPPGTDGNDNGTIRPPAIQPRAMDDTLLVDEDGRVSFDLLANDTFDTTAALSIDLGIPVAAPETGFLTFVPLPDGGIVRFGPGGGSLHATFDPAGAFAGLNIGDVAIVEFMADDGSLRDFFGYTLHQGDLADGARVRVEVHGINDAPEVRASFDLRSFEPFNPSDSLRPGFFAQIEGQTRSGDDVTFLSPFALRPGDDAAIIFVDEFAALPNSLGVYLIGADGTVLDRIAFSDIEHALPNPDFPAARPGGGALSGGESVLLSDLFSSAELGDAVAFGLFLIEGQGGRRFDANRPDGPSQSVSGPVDDIYPGLVTGPIPDNLFVVGFEDVLRSGDSDSDFNDAVFLVQLFDHLSRQVAFDVRIDDPDDANMSQASVAVADGGRLHLDPDRFTDRDGDGFLEDADGRSTGIRLHESADGSRLLFEGQGSRELYEDLLGAIVLDTGGSSSDVTVNFTVTDDSGGVTGSERRVETGDDTLIVELARAPLADSLAAMAGTGAENDLAPYSALPSLDGLIGAVGHEGVENALVR